MSCCQQHLLWWPSLGAQSHLPSWQKGTGAPRATLTASIGTREPGFCPGPRQPLNLKDLRILASAWVWQLENWLYFPDGGD